jgi:hypothetical protein
VFLMALATRESDAKSVAAFREGSWTNVRDPVVG